MESNRASEFNEYQSAEMKVVHRWCEHRINLQELK
jgi:hypothetical protein